MPEGMAKAGVETEGKPETVGATLSQKASRVVPGNDAPAGSSRLARAWNARTRVYLNWTGGLHHQNDQAPIARVYLTD